MSEKKIATNTFYQILTKIFTSASGFITDITPLLPQITHVIASEAKQSLYYNGIAASPTIVALLAMTATNWGNVRLHYHDPHRALFRSKRLRRFYQDHCLRRFFYLITDFGLNAVFLQLEEKEARFSRLLSLRLLLSLLIILAINFLVLLLPFNHSWDIGFPPQLRLCSFIFSLTIIFQAILLSSSAIFQKNLDTIYTCYQ